MEKEAALCLMLCYEYNLVTFQKFETSHFFKFILVSKTLDHGEYILLNSTVCIYTY